MQAEGVLSTILPALPVTELNGVKIYPEQADTNSAPGDQGITSKRTESQALIATQAGTITLPAIDITWWDVEEEKVQVTSLPSRTIEVTGANKRPQTDSTAATPDISQAHDAPPLPLGQGNSVNRTWQWIAIAFFCLWLLTLAALMWIFLARSKHQKTQAENANNQPVFNASLLKEAKKQLESACQSKDAKQARNALIALFKQLYRNANIRNLMDVETAANSADLNAAIKDLDAALYRGGDHIQWEPGNLMQAAMKALEQPSDNKGKQVLEPLYPN